MTFELKRRVSAAWSWVSRAGRRPIKYAAIFIGIAAIVAVWLSTIWLVPYAAQFVPSANGAPSDAGQYGAIGDMFGAINALFSGLALAAIALTLWTESRSRREARKPLVICGIKSIDLTVGKPSATDGGCLLPIRIPVQFSNQSNEAALNVGGKLRICFGSKQSWSVGIDGPLLKDADQEINFDLKLDRKDWEPLLSELTSQRPVEIEVAAIYRSLEGVNWKTVVTYSISINAADQHYDLLNSVRNGTWSAEGVWRDDALVALFAAVKQGSWDHRLH